MNVSLDGVLTENKSLPWFQLKLSLVFIVISAGLTGFCILWGSLNNNPVFYYIAGYFLGGLILFILTYNKAQKKIELSEDWQSKLIQEKVVTEVLQQDLLYAQLNALERETNIKVNEWNKKNKKKQIKPLPEPRPFNSIAEQATEKGHYERVFKDQSTKKREVLSDN